MPQLKSKTTSKKEVQPFIYPQDPSVFIFAGTDEVGRGPLVGNVVAAAVILDPDKPIVGLADSKKLSEKKREELYPVIIANAKAYAIGKASPAEIDELNILWASMLAMQRAIDALPITPQMVLVDGNRVPPKLTIPAQAVVGGDAKVAEISAASIIAKVTRDHEMIALDKEYPQYGFARHKGYPTAEHLKLIAQYGVLPCYRRSYAPVKKILGL